MMSSSVAASTGMTLSIRYRWYTALSSCCMQHGMHQTDDADSKSTGAYRRREEEESQHELYMHVVVVEGGRAGGRAPLTSSSCMSFWPRGAGSSSSSAPPCADDGVIASWPVVRDTKPCHTPPPPPPSSSGSSLEPPPAGPYPTPSLCVSTYVMLCGQVCEGGGDGLEGRAVERLDGQRCARLQLLLAALR